MISSVPESIKKSRDHVARWFAGRRYSVTTLESARSVVTELVTNAYQHAGGETIVVRVYQSAIGPTIEVWDSSEALPVVFPLDLTSESGRGLAFIELVVETWGAAVVTGLGKAVFAVLKGDAE